MFDKANDELLSLQGKKRTIEADKAKIHRVRCFRFNQYDSCSLPQAAVTIICLINSNLQHRLAAEWRRS